MKELLNKYPFIVAHHATSDQKYILSVCKEAHKSNQPRTVTYQLPTGKWANVNQYRNKELIRKFKVIAFNHNINVEFNKKVLNTSLFFKNALIHGSSSRNIYDKCVKTVDKIDKAQIPWGTKKFFDSFYGAFVLTYSSNEELETLVAITEESKDWMR